MYQQPLTVSSKAAERSTERVSHLLKLLPVGTPLPRPEEIQSGFIKYAPGHIGGSLVDIGAGNAEITVEVAKTYGLDTAFALDVYPFDKFILPKSDYQGNLHYIQMKDRIMVPEKSAYLVTAFMVIHHIDNFPKLLRDIKMVLKPGGFFFFREHDVKTQEMKYYLYGIHEKFTPGIEHMTNRETYWSRSQLKQLLELNGFKHMGDSDYLEKNPQAIYHSLYQLK